MRAGRRDGPRPRPPSRLVTRAGAASAVYRLSALGESFANGPLAQLARWAEENQAGLADMFGELTEVTLVD